MTHKRRAPLPSTFAANVSYPESDVPCVCPSCLADPRYQADHQRKEDARARERIGAYCLYALLHYALCDMHYNANMHRKAIA
ncbi:hypothetical protein ZOSMA_80G00430 [Zostera marina]|uniref:Uncharacterized protein n=1 Tax=Zostera marina TaxID=29655 RepID=A0A0K9NPN9_ZOSMR|nr:hypothetical protein ZOSMA_80G00430 [Zostera marina]